MYNLKTACFCHRGKVRTQNEDNFFFGGRYLEIENDGLEKQLNKSISLKEPVTLAVFDGMGGQEAGAEAAFLAAETLSKMKSEDDSYGESFLLDFCREANQKIYDFSDHYRKGMPGTTAVILDFLDSKVSLCNIGDSKAFLFRNNVLQQLSVDHVEEEIYSRMRGEKKPRLTQNLGIDPEELRITPYVKTWDIQADDVFLICSDGLTDMISENEITEIILKYQHSVSKTVKSLVNEALSKGGKDNITVILSRIYK